MPVTPQTWIAPWVPIKQSSVMKKNTIMKISSVAAAFLFLVPVSIMWIGSFILDMSNWKSANPLVVFIALLLVTAILYSPIILLVCSSFRTKCIRTEFSIISGSISFLFLISSYLSCRWFQFASGVIEQDLNTYDESNTERLDMTLSGFALVQWSLILVSASEFIILILASFEAQRTKDFKRLTQFSIS